MVINIESQKKDLFGLEQKIAIVFFTWALAFIYIYWVYLYFPSISDPIDWYSVVSEGFLSLFVAVGLLVVSKHQGQFKIYAVISIGLALLFFAFATDTLDEFVEMPEYLNFVIEGLFQDIGVILLVVGLYGWVREREELLSALKELAARDALTGVYNRRTFEILFKSHVFGALRYNQNLSVIVIDIDHFKKINDIYGHIAGDEFLQKFCQMVSQQLRSSDIFCRYGGEEFVVVLLNTNLQEAMQFAEITRDAVRKMNMSFKESISASFGVAQLKENEAEHDLLKRADEALYKAKDSGRNCVVAAAG